MLERRKHLLAGSLFLSWVAWSLCFSTASNAQDLRGRFIWSVPNSRGDIAPGIVYFRKVFEAKQIKSGLLEVTCDDGCRVYLNGKLVGSDTVWKDVIRYDISALLVEGKNVIAVHAENASRSPAGLYCKITVNTQSETVTIPSDKSWKFSSTAGNDWKLADFNDSTWKTALEQGVFGRVQPWGSEFNFRTEGAVSVRRDKSRLKRDKWELVDGDRVVFLGGTFIERLQTTDYFESLLTSQFANLNLTFRNLGWSGDNVFGLSRAVFGNQEDGFRRLENDLLLSDPTLVIVNYGFNESFKGPDNIAEFRSGLDRLTKLIKSNQADIVFLSPMLMEKLESPLPDPKSQNKNIQLYTNVLREFAASNGHGFIDNLKPLGDRAFSKTDVPAIRDQLTDNGVHLNDYGQWRIAPHLVRKLGGNPQSCKFDIDVNQESFTCTNSTITQLEFEKGVVSFSAKDDHLVFSPSPRHTPRGGKMMAIHDTFRIRGLPPGKYGLKINGKPSILASAKQWAAGVLINRGNYLPQAEELRKTILRKNEMFFHRHRPQNETYLYLFRKHEQGNNAVEIPRFDPIIADLEKKISKLKKPNVVQYQLHQIESAKSD